MSESIRSFSKDWPEQHHFYSGESAEQLEQKFVANLYLSVQRLLDAHRNYFRTMSAPPENEQAPQRWGIKDVRLSIDHACYLKWLFPKAKFLFLIRNPYVAS